MPIDRQQAERIVGGMDQDRSSWIDHWRDLADYMDPWSARFITGVGGLPGTAGGSGAPVGGNVNRGDKRHGKILDSTATFALRSASAGMMSGITSPARPWFSLTVPDPHMREDQSVKEWLDLVTRDMRDLFVRSNLYSALPQLYQDIFQYGTGAMSFEEDPDKVFDFRHRPIGSYLIAQGPQGRVDRYARRLRMTADQIMRAFSDSRQVDGYPVGISDAVRRSVKDTPDGWYDVWHMVLPSPDAGRYGDLDPRGKAYLSLWWEPASRAGQFLRVEGYSEFPILAPRWRTLGEDVYGNGPGFDALPDTKSLQVLTRQKATANEKAVNPPLLADSTLAGKIVNVSPGGITWMDGKIAGDNNGLRSLYQTQFDIRGTLEDIADHRSRINDAFFVSLFLMLTQDRRSQPPTAEEIRAREAERMLMLGPVLERLNDELLDPLIDRAFAIMLRRGLLPPPPPELEGVELKVEYISILAQAQKAVGLGSIDRLTGTAMTLAQVDQGVLDKIDWDQVIDETAAMLGTPPALVRSDEDVAAVRQQRAQAQAAAQQTAMAAEQAKTAKTLSETDTERPSALTDLLG